MPNDRDSRVEDVRRFNRFYTRRIGVLEEGLLHSPFSLTEARVIYELAQKEETTATDLARELGIDRGYMARMLQSFQKRSLLRRKQSREDGRQKILQLSEKGRKAFEQLNAASRKQVREILEPMPDTDQQRLLRSMHTIASLLGGPPVESVSYILRSHQPGDMGWVVWRHGILYSTEYSWDEQFEALIAEIVAKFLRKFDPKKEHCWIAEKDGENVGCVFLVKRSENIAQLRLLLVEPHARGLGIGKRLVSECTRFARQAGYKKIMLWTNDVLHAARHLYEQEGYHLKQEDHHHSFGHDLVGQIWEMRL